VRRVDRRTWLQIVTYLLLTWGLLGSFLIPVPTPSARADQNAEELAGEALDVPPAAPPRDSCQPGVDCNEEAKEIEDDLLNGELVVPEKTIAAGKYLILRHDMLPSTAVEERFPPGYKYYFIDRFGLIDLTHVNHGRDQMEQVLQQLPRGYIQLTFVTQRSPTTDTAIRLTGIYRIRPDLPAKQRQHAALGIVMDFEQLIEAHQSPGSSFAVEDLPSDYVGYFLALHPQWDAQELLTMLDSDRTPTGVDSTLAHLYKSFRRNREFRPIPARGADHVNWPLLLQMEPAGRWSGFWQRNAVIVSHDRRTWWQKWSDWGLKALEVLF